MAKENKGRINIQIDRDVGSGEYANFVVITHSNAEFVMDFTRLLPGMDRARVNSRIVMAPPHAKAFLRALNDNIARFEKKYGEIQVPGKETFSPFGLSPPEGTLPD